MSEIEADIDLQVALRALSDDELRAAIRAATAGRPSLGAIHEAATVVEATVAPAVPTDASAVPTDAPAVPISAPAPDYTDSGVPTMTGVRDKVGRAIGSAELERESPHGKSLEQQWEERRAAGHERLEQIRKSMKESE